MIRYWLYKSCYITDTRTYIPQYLLVKGTRDKEKKQSRNRHNNYHSVLTPNETGHERRKSKSIKQNCEIILTLSSPTQTLLWINRSHLSHAPIVHNNNTMDTKFMVEMRQSNKCGGVMTDEIFNLPLASGADTWISIPCLLHDTSNIYWFQPPTHLRRKKQRTTKWDSTPENFSTIVLVYLNRIKG